MKSGDTRRLMAIRSVLAEVTRVEKDVRREATDDEVLAQIRRERSKRDEALEFARKANRQDLVAQNEAESRLLGEYLPAQLAPDQVRAAIAEIVASGAAQIGPVMKALRDRFGAQLDSKLASDLVKEALAKR